MLIWIVLSILLLSAMILLVGYIFSAPGHRGPVTKHFDGKKFHNISGVEVKGFKSTLKWSLERDLEPWHKNYETDFGSKPNDTETELTITFVNHSTFLIQWNDLNVLTDPIWSERCSPFSFVGPQRMRPPGIAYEDLPSIDVIILSHNHYDHLDLPTLKNLERDFSPVFVVPLGVKEFLAKSDIQNIIELDWWQEANAGVNVKSIPAQHFSGRGIFDRNRTLWSGYTIEYSDKKVYFAGDSGYGDFFKEIGNKEGPMDVSLIPIGAYLPNWFMSPIHMSPLEAVKVHKDVKSKQSIATHFGTFPLADEGQGKAEEDLILALDQMGVPQKKFLIPQEGEPIKL